MRYIAPLLGYSDRVNLWQLCEELSDFHERDERERVVEGPLRSQRYVSTYRYYASLAS